MPECVFKAAGFDQLKSARFNLDRDEDQIATSLISMTERNLNANCSFTPKLVYNGYHMLDKR